MSQKEPLNTRNSLIASFSELEKSLLVFKDINQKAHFIALNAAIEGARMRSKLGTFSIVANQIAGQASKNNELSEKLEMLIAQIRSQSLDAVAVRNLELAADLIDKLDRNLFERNCDVQAWATFDVVKNALLNPNEASSQAAAEQLNKLVTIYMVYSDSILLDTTGKVISTAKRGDLLGLDLSKEDWFQGAKSGSIQVSDTHFSKFTNGYAVAYCSPVTTNEGVILGVLANFFDWSFALEMISSGEYSANSEAIIINSNAQVIAGKRKSQILYDSYDWLRGGEWAAKGGVGFSLERSRNGEPISVGYCHTKGYNAYKGKGWSAILAESIGDVHVQSQTTLVEARGEGISQISEEVRKNAIEGEIESEASGKRLLQTMKEIDTLVYEINANNREVKLLAVNASIQAGLAGAEGEGFSIIANEVAVLAKKSLNFVETVNSTTSKLNNAVVQSSSVRLLDAAKDTMSKIDRNIFERYCDIQAWSTFSKFSEVLKNDGRADETTLQLLERVHKIYEVYHDIYILNTKGDVIGTAINRGLMGSNFSHREWFTIAVSGATYYSDIYNSEALKLPLMTFSAPIFDEDKRIIGVIASRFNCNFLNDILRASIIDSKSNIYLLNENGNVIASRENSEIYKLQFPSLAVLKNTQKENFGIVDEKLDGEPVTIGYSSSKGYNSYRGQKWVLVTKRPNEIAKRSASISPAERFTQRIQKARAA